MVVLFYYGHARAGADERVNYQQLCHAANAFEDRGYHQHHDWSDADFEVFEHLKKIMLIDGCKEVILGRLVSCWTRWWGKNGTKFEV